MREFFLNCSLWVYVHEKNRWFCQKPIRFYHLPKHTYDGSVIELGAAMGARMAIPADDKTRMRFVILREFLHLCHRQRT